MASDEIVTRTARVWLMEPRIVYATTFPNAVQTLADAQENARAEAQLMGDQSYVLLVDMRQIRSQDREAREFYTSPDNTTRHRAVAILIGSPVSRVIGNFFIGFNKTSIPTRLFTSEADALAWLRGYL